MKEAKFGRTEVGLNSNEATAPFIGKELEKSPNYLGRGGEFIAMEVGDRCVQKVGYRHIKLGVAERGVSGLQEYIEEKRDAMEKAYGDVGTFLNVAPTRFVVEEVAVDSAYMNSLSKQPEEAQIESGTYPTIVAYQEKYDFEDTSLWLRPAFYKPDVSSELDAEEGLWVRAAGNMLFAQGREQGEEVDAAYRDLSFVQAVHDRGSLMYFVDTLRNGNHHSLKKCIEDLAEGCSKYTIQTGQIVDLIGQDNVLIWQDEKGEYDYIITDPCFPSDIMKVHNNFLEYGSDFVLQSSHTLFMFTILTNYVRSVNVTMAASGRAPALDIRCRNFDASREPSTELSFKDWYRIQQHREAQLDELGEGHRPVNDIFEWLHPARLTQLELREGEISLQPL